MSNTCTISREGEDVVIRMPLAEAQAFRVSISPCPCKAPKSTGNMQIRERLIMGLGKAIIKSQNTRFDL